MQVPFGTHMHICCYAIRHHAKEPVNTLYQHFLVEKEFVEPKRTANLI